MAFDVQKAQKYSNPIDVFGKDYAELQAFFQYSFPPKRLSAQSWELQENLSDSQKDALYFQMLYAVGMTSQDLFFSCSYCLNNNPDLKIIQQMGLSDSTFIYDKRKGFSQITNATKNRSNEHKLTALSRRLRDSFGHGRIGLKEDYVLFEDISDKNGKQTITGRIILHRDDLKTWKKVIEQYIADNKIECS